MTPAARRAATAAFTATVLLALAGIVAPLWGAR
jgi:hypothetical protein